MARKRRSSFGSLDDPRPPKMQARKRKEDSRSEEKYCDDCKKTYTVDRVHWAVCGRKQVPCVYPHKDSATGVQQTVILYRGMDGYFKCIRCEKLVKKDQSIMNHARKCMLTAEPALQEEQSEFGGEAPAEPPAAQPACPIGDHLVDERASSFQPTLPQPGISVGPSVDTTNTIARLVDPLPRTPALSSGDSQWTSGDTNRTPATPNQRNKVPTPLNQYELLILPDEHSTIDDPLLRCTPYIINTKYKVLICTDCRHCINPSRASEHLRKNHSHCKVGTKFTTEVVTKYPGLVNETIHPRDIINPVFGLAISKEEYTVCTRCRRGYVNLSTWRHHACAKADTDLEGVQEHFPSHVQTFFLGPNICYFPVSLPATTLDEGRRDDFDVFQSTFQDLGVSEEEVGEPEDYRVLNQFLLKEGWLKHVSGYSVSELFLLTTPPQEDEILRPIAKEVIGLMSDIQAAVGSAGYHVRRLLGKRPSDNHDSTRTVAHRDVQEGTLKKYSLIVTCLISFVFRCFQGWECSYAMRLTASQEEACQHLKDCLSEHQNGFKDDTHLPMDRDECTEFDDDEIDDLDDEVYESLEGSMAECMENLPDLTYTTLQRRILALLVALFTHLPSGGDDKFHSPIFRFLILYSLKKNGQWLAGRRITQLFSALLFCGREVMMTLLRDDVNQSSGLRFSEAYGRISPFLDDEQEGPIPSMYIVMRYLNRFSSAEEGSLRFTALDFSGTNIIVAGHVLYLRDIRYFVETIIQEVKELLRVDLFFGLDVFDVNWSPGVVHEEPRNRSLGYSSFRDRTNSFHQHRFDLVRVMLTHPSLRGRFHFITKEGKIVWKPGACFAYMGICHDVEMLLFSGTQTSVGEPARGSEFASHLINNVSGGMIRNVFNLFQFFCMMGTFNKTSHLTERDVTMIRVPHPEIGRLWMLYLTFVRPTVIMWQDYFSGRKAAKRARDHLFFGPYRPVTSSELSKNLAQHTERILKIKISIGLWRHIATWFLNHHAVRFQEHHKLLNRASLAAQSGHSEGMHTQYAADVRLPAGIDFHAVFDTMRTSGVWHTLIEFSKFSQPSLLEAMRHMLGPSEVGGTVTVPIPPAVENVSYGTYTTDTVEVLRRTVLPDFIKAISQSRANDLACLLDSVGINVESPPSRPLSQPVMYTIHPSRLHDLRTFLKDGSASFKDPQQAEALELIRGREPSLLVIGPTGSGKTLPIFMSISLYDRGASTVMILPLIAMHEEYKLRARKYGVSCRTWSSECDPSASPQLLLVAVESCTWADLQHYISTLVRLGRLARIVVDEAHLLLKHETFRPCMTMLSFLGTHPVSMVLMTATCPPRLEKALFEKLGRKVYKVLRRSTDRPEISQHFIPIQGDPTDLENEVAKNIASRARTPKGTERALLFCNSLDECNRMADLLGWKAYHSDIPIESRSEAMKLWKDGSTFGLVCTSMLNCCLDYPDVRYVFHLGPPRDAVDYYQAIGRLARLCNIGVAIVYFNPASLRKWIGNGDDLFGQQIILDMLADILLCRRLRPGMFLDGIAVPCVMLPNAQLCDACAAQLACQPPDQGLLCISNQLASGSPSCLLSQVVKPTAAPLPPVLLPDPLRQPAPSATFAHHLAAANAAVAAGGVLENMKAEDSGRSIRVACDNLAKSCVNCWCNGFEYHSHGLPECPYKPVNLYGDNWKKWTLVLRLPIGCCFYCGCPQKMFYFSKHGQKLRVHDHDYDQSCHWTNVLKPLAYIVFQNATLIQSLSRSSYSGGKELGIMDHSEYAKWICEYDEKDCLNLLNVLWHICDLRGIPVSPL